MKLSNEAKVGIMVSAAVILLGVLTFRTGNFRISNDGYLVVVHFQNIDGISTNSPVMFNGFEVGRVKSIGVKDEPTGVKMEVGVWLDPGVKIHEEAKAYVKNMGFMGEKYIGLTSGNAAKGYLKEGDLIVGSDPADLDKILSDAQDIASDIRQISAAVSEKLQKHDGAIDRIFVNLDSSVSNVAAITGDIKANSPEIVSNIKSTTVNLDIMTYDLMMNPWKLIFRTKEQKLDDLKYLKNADK